MGIGYAKGKAEMIAKHTPQAGFNAQGHCDTCRGLLPAEYDQCADWFKLRHPRLRGHEVHCPKWSLGFAAKCDSLLGDLDLDTADAHDRLRAVLQWCLDECGDCPHCRAIARKIRGALK